MSYHPRFERFKSRMHSEKGRKNKWNKVHKVNSKKAEELLVKVYNEKGFPHSFPQAVEALGFDPKWTHSMLCSSMFVASMPPTDGVVDERIIEIQDYAEQNVYRFLITAGWELHKKSLEQTEEKHARRKHIQPAG